MVIVGYFFQRTPPFYFKNLYAIDPEIVFALYIIPKIRVYNHSLLTKVYFIIKIESKALELGGNSMALKITEDCISCGACEAVCPVEAISQGEEFYEIDPEICVECEGHYDEPQCADVCPTDACVKA